MKTPHRSRRRMSCPFLILQLIAFCALFGSVGAQDWKKVHDGVEHAEMRREISGKNVDIDLIRLDLRRVRLDVKHANGSAIGTETTSSIANRAKAVAAINAGFFRLDTSPFAGDPVGLFVVDGKPLSESNNDRIQMIINNLANRTEVRFARSNLRQSIRIGEETVAVSGINRELKEQDAVIYTPEFGRTTGSKPGSLELVIIKGVITAVLSDVGNAAIPSNGYVLSLVGEIRERIAPMARSAATVTLVQEWEGLPPEFVKDRNRLDVVTGVPQLIRNGRIDITWELERSSRAFVETRHPRTAVARLKNGKFLLMTADGRTEASGGLALSDLAALLLELGAEDAINLDGGGSTTMVLHGKVVNRPSDPQGERKVSDAIVVTTRRK